MTTLAAENTRPAQRDRAHRGKGQHLAGYLFLSPALILFAAFVAGPLISAAVLSFYSWDLLTPARFDGLHNYSRMFGDSQLYKAIVNTFVFTAASMVTHLVGGLLLALGVNQLKNRFFSYVVRTSLFFPFVISWAAVALLWKYVLDPTFGVGTYYIEKLGVHAPNWFLDPSWALAAIIGIDFWHTIGFTFVIMFAGLQTVPKELLEAARSDGASARQTLWNVTIPLMSPTIFFASVVTFIGAFQIFDPMQIITPDGGPNNSTTSVVMYLYQRGFQSFQIGYASAVSLLIFAVTMVVTLLQFWGIAALGARVMTAASLFSRRRRPSTGRVLIAVALLVVAVLMLAPLVWLVVESFTPERDAFGLPPNWVPRPFTLDNFRGISGLIPFGRMALNSLEVAVISTAGCLLVSVLAGYAFSRLRFFGSRTVLVLMLSALMVPVQTTVIPIFVMMRNLGLVDQLPSLWLPALINVFAIFFFRQYFNTIPRELDEAARIDGAGHLWILFRVLIPLSGPAIAAMTILVFEASWNNYFGPLIFISSPQNMTLPIGLVTLQAGQNGSSVIVFAAITAVVVPVLLVFVLFQRSFVASVAASGLRG